MGLAPGPAPGLPPTTDVDPSPGLLTPVPSLQTAAPLLGLVTLLTTALSNQGYTEALSPNLILLLVEGPGTTAMKNTSTSS